MFEHFERGDEVEAGEAQRADIAALVIDGEPGPGGVRTCRRDVFRRRIHSRHCCTQPGQRLAQQPRAAPDIKRAAREETTANNAEALRPRKSRLRNFVSGRTFSSAIFPR